MEEFEIKAYFVELIKYYTKVLDNLTTFGKELWCKNVSMLDLKIFKNNIFNKSLFDIYFDQLKEDQKYNLYNYILSHDLIQHTPLEIRVKIAEYYKNSNDLVNNLLIKNKSYLKFYKENKSFRVIYHSRDYYHMYLNECNFDDIEFKSKILDKIKN